MASFYSGSAGELQFGGTDQKRIGKVRDWQFTSSVNMLQTTTLGDTDGTVTNGVRTQSGSFTLYYYDEPDDTSTVYASTVIGKLLKAATDYSINPGVAAENDSFNLRLKVNASSGSKWVQGKVYLNSVAMAMAVGDVLSAQCSFTVDGAFEEVSL